MKGTAGEPCCEWWAAGLSFAIYAVGCASLIPRDFPNMAYQNSIKWAPYNRLTSVGQGGSLWL